MIEIVTFSLKAEGDETAFCAANETVQQGFFYAQPGLLRRTAARSSESQWAVLTYWDGAESADNADRKSSFPADFDNVAVHIDLSTLTRARYEEL